MSQTRIHRWEFAPEDLREIVDPTGVATWDWLAQIPADRREEELGVTWTDQQQAEGPDGSLIVVGLEPVTDG